MICIAPAAEFFKSYPATYPVIHSLPGDGTCEWCIIPRQPIVRQVTGHPVSCGLIASRKIFASQRQMNNDLLRQRRNLLITSIGLLLFDFANVSVSHVSIIGTELLVGDVQTLTIFVWLMWLYFLVRYYQYRNAEGDLGIKSAAFGMFLSKASGYVLEKNGLKSILGHVTVVRHGGGWNYSVVEQSGRITPREIDGGSLPLIRSWWWRLSSYLYLAVHTQKVTDHVLPLVLAIATPLVIIGRLMW